MEGAVSQVQLSPEEEKGDGVCVEDFKGEMVMWLELQKMAYLCRRL